MALLQATTETLRQQDPSIIWSYAGAVGFSVFMLKLIVDLIERLYKVFKPANGNGSGKTQNGSAGMQSVDNWRTMISEDVRRELKPFIEVNERFALTLEKLDATLSSINETVIKMKAREEVLTQITLARKAS